jgi:hypothetical protein
LQLCIAFCVLHCLKAAQLVGLCTLKSDYRVSIRLVQALKFALLATTAAELIVVLCERDQASKERMPVILFAFVSCFLGAVWLEGCSCLS